MINAVSAFNNKTSSRKVGPNFENDMSHPTCRTVYHGLWRLFNLFIYSKGVPRNILITLIEVVFLVSSMRNKNIRLPDRWRHGSLALGNSD